MPVREDVVDDCDAEGEHRDTGDRGENRARRERAERERERGVDDRERHDLQQPVPRERVVNAAGGCV